MTEEVDLRAQFLQGMSCAAATVNVVTTDGPAGRAGVTVSAMASVSADGEHPTMLVCVHHQSPSAQTIIDNGCFCTNVLRDDQSFISDTFAGRLPTEDGDKFSCADWRAMTTAAPRVRDPLAAFDCRVKSSERVGTHHVFIGEVQEIFVAGSGSPLIFANRAYGSPVQIHPARSAPRDDAATLRMGALHTFGPYLVPSMLRTLEDEVGKIDLELHEGDQRHLMELLSAGTIDLALVYDFNLGEDITRSPVAKLPPYVLLAKEDPLAASDALSLEDLAPHPMVLLDAPPSRDYFLSLFDDTAPPNVAYRAKSFEMVRGMVAHGLGYSLLATKPASSMSYDGMALTMRPLKNAIARSQLVLAERADASNSDTTSRVRDHCLKALGVSGF